MLEGPEDANALAMLVPLPRDQGGSGAKPLPRFFLSHRSLQIPSSARPEYPKYRSVTLQRLLRCLSGHYYPGQLACRLSRGVALHVISIISPCHPWRPPPASTSTSTHCNAVRMAPHPHHRSDPTSRLYESGHLRAKVPPVYPSHRQSMVMPPHVGQGLTKRTPPLSRVLRSMQMSSEPPSGKGEG